MAARYRNWTPEVVRQRIRVGLLMRRLQNQALGKLEMSQGEQRAIEILLRKALPDLTSVEYKAVDQRDARELTTSELDQRIAALEGEKSSRQQSDKSTGVH